MFSVSRYAGKLGRESLKRANKSTRRNSRLNLCTETLEERALLATNPLLIGIQPDVGQVLTSGDTRQIAPRELAFRFDSGQAIDPASLGGIQIVRGGADGAIGTNDDVTVTASREVGILGNDVILRFGENLPDDRYQIKIFGTGAAPLRNVSGDPFDGNPTVTGNQDLTLFFTLDLGTKVSAVVPQPIARNPDGSLSQALDQIEIYFNDNDLSPALVTDPSYYQLTLTQDTATNTDDMLINPMSVSYDPVAAKAVLTFNGALHTLAGGSGTYRLRVGTALTALPLAPSAPVIPAMDPGDSFDDAEDLSVLTGGSRIVDASIEPQFFPLNFPGSPFEPGHRDPSVQAHVSLGPDLIDGVSSIAYNFQSTYSVNGGSTFANLITENQKQRAREIFEIYGSLLGVDFVETSHSGFTIVTGDLRSIDPTANVAAGDGTTAGFAFEDLGLTFNRFAGWLVLDNSETWNDEFAADPLADGPISWFAEAMEGIGGLLGISAADDLPQLTVTSDNTSFSLDQPIEAIFPGDHDIVHGQYSYRPDSIDIDMYRFEVTGTASGLFTAEIFAERLDDSSLLDSTLRLYRQEGSTFELIAQNDDYYSEDSFLELTLSPGTYYVGVSSTGNDQYDPHVAGSGFGGTSQGDYQLRLDFRPEVSDSLLDASGVAFDGDGDGVAGGEFNFWFEAAAPSGTQAAGDARTIYVDKADTTPDRNTDGTFRTDVGTISNPFNVIYSALNQNQEGIANTGGNINPQAALAGDIVRIVGNDSNLDYRLGRAFGTNAPFADGAKMDIPRDVTVMIDAGAVLKFQRTGILVGSTAVTIDHSSAALQLLGIPNKNVQLTSINDDNDPATSPAPVRGDWGGILFAGDLDRAEGRFSYEDQSIFLNYVGQATIRFGGGIVNVGSIPQAIAPIDIRELRPTVQFSKMISNGVAAVSATPDSFEETNFQEPRFQSTLFTSDYTRIGPDIHDNSLSANTINGLFIRLVTPAGGELRRMTVSGRWDDADIIHVLTEVLEIQGTPGGPTAIEVNPGGATLEDQFDFVARRDARLAIDPNVVVKLGGARIETGLGAQLLAEGLDGQEIIFTSVQDDRFGASGSYDTSNNLSTVTAQSGDWSGIYLGPYSTGSVDYATFAYGGGTSAIEGGSAAFNVMEVHQARTRVTNSSFFDNAGGTLGEDITSREGRGRNAAGAIFISGAQPIIVNNSIVNTAARSLTGLQPARGRNDIGAAININANSLNHVVVTDYGRSTGQVSKQSSNLGNQGPLIRGNRLQGNDLNGMLVRGATLTTESVWDDTDIVHAMVDTIYVPNFHSFGGLRLESSASESLVVKIGGSPNAGFTATGSALEIDDRIGGALQIVGQPGRPVVLTSMSDSSVGAGTTLNGSIQNFTLRTELTSDEPPPGFNIDLIFSTELAGNSDVQAAIEAAAEFWESRLDDQVSVAFDVFLDDLDPGVAGNALGQQQTFPFDEVITRMQDDGSDNEQLLQSLPFFSDLQTIFADGTDVMVSPTVQLTYANAKALGYTDANLVAVPSEIDAMRNRDGVINIDTSFSTGGNLDNLTTVMIHEIGHALGFISNADNITSGGDFVLTSLDLFRMQPGDGLEDFTNNPRVFDDELEHVFFAGADFFDPEEAGLTIMGLTLGDIPLSRGEDSADEAQASHWRDEQAPGMNGFVIGVMDPSGGEYSDQDQRAFDLIGYDFIEEFGFSATPGAGDWRGVLFDGLAHDRNVDVHVERESPDANVTGSNSIPDRAEFVGGLARGERSGDENLRLGFQINGVLNTSSDVDVYSFNATSGTEVWLDIDRTASSLDSVVELIDADGVVLARSDDSYSGDEQGFLAGLVPQGLQRSLSYREDYFSSNPRDSGMRLSLPGAAATVGTYFVRVRSYSDDLTNVSGGQTTGKYELSIRVGEVDEVAGSVVKYADIRFANNGVNVTDQIAHSPLQVENVKIGNTSVASPQPIGNPLGSNLGLTGVSGRLDSPNDVNWYEMEVNWPAVDSDTSLASLIFDIDFADGTGNANTTLSVFELNRITLPSGLPSQQPRLIYVGEKSNILDDQSPLLSAGSLGLEDPFIGPVNFSQPRTYLIAVSSDANRPVEAYDQFVKANADNKNVRLEPIDSTNRIADPSGNDLIASATIDPFTLNDMTLFVTAEGGNNLTAINPFNGTSQGPSTRLLGTDTGYTVNSLAMRGDGSLFSLSLGMDDNTSGNLLDIDWAQGAAIVENLGDDEIVTYHDPMPMMPEELNDGIQFSGMTFTGSQIYAVGHRGNQMAMGVQFYNNIVYQIDGYPFEIDGNNTDPGTIIPTGPNRQTDDPMIMDPPYITGAWTDVVEVGVINTNMGGPGGTIEGITTVNGTIYGISSNGGLYRFVPGAYNTPGTTTFIATIAPGMVGLTTGPAGPGLNNTLFAMSSSGRLYAFSTTGAPRNVFWGGAPMAPLVSNIQTTASSPTDLAFSTLDKNLWHQVGSRLVFNAPTPSMDGAVPRFNTGNESTAAVRNKDYNFPGGARGSFTTAGFDLSAYGEDDEPYLYFKYTLSTEHDALNDTDDGVDMLRVYVTDASGQERLMATNHSAGTTFRPDPDGGPTEANRNNEFDILPTDGRVDNNSAGYGVIQELYDNTEQLNPDFDPMNPSDPQERQARVSLREFAGQTDVKLRFEFSTKGTFEVGRTGDAFGDPLHGVTRFEDGTTDNSFAGPTISEIIVGFAERGEAVVGARTAVPDDPDSMDDVPVDSAAFANFLAARPNQIQVGAYQLEIRPATEYSPADTPGPFDTNDRHFAGAISILAPLANNIMDGDVFSIADERGTVVFEFDSNASVQTAGAVGVTFMAGQSAEEIAVAIETAVNSATVQASPVRVKAAISSTDRTVVHLVGESLFVSGIPTVIGGIPTLGGGKGDTNRFRGQGQLILSSNIIRDSAEYGIRVETSEDSTVAAGNLLVTNTPRLVPGVVISNNLIQGSGIGGIRYAGAPDSESLAVPFGRIINNTIVSGTFAAPSGIGVDVGPNASPTLVNNVIAFNTTGILVDRSSTGSVVITGSLFHRNSNTGPTGTNAILTTPAEPVFQDPANGNFLPAQGSRAIDSSVNTIEDRPALVTVKSPIGIGLSPILAPDRDIYGQVRVDDPNVDSPPGLGSNVIKDRGAFERADGIGPRAEVSLPADNSALDSDPDLGEVSTSGQSFGYFEIQLVDIDVTGNDANGVGVDDATVTPESVLVYRDGQLLEFGVDYNLSYISTNDVLRIIPLAGVWVPGVYRIELSNSIVDLEGNRLATDTGSATKKLLIGVDRPADESSLDGWHNSANPPDVNNDGSVVAQDAVIVINEINLRNVSDPLTGALPTVATPPPFYDVNDDGFVAANDANIIITRINIGPAPLSATTRSPLSSGPTTGAADNTSLSVDLALRTMGSTSGNAGLFDRFITDAESENGNSTTIDAIFANWA